MLTQYIRFASETGTLTNKKKEDIGMGLTTCPKCGETISEKATVCPCCNSAVKQKQKKHKGVFKSIIVFTLIVVSVLGISDLLSRAW